MGPAGGEASKLYRSFENVPDRKGSGRSSLSRNVSDSLGLPCDADETFRKELMVGHW